MRTIYFRKYKLYISLVIIIFIGYIYYTYIGDKHEGFHDDINTISFITYGNEKFTSAKTRLIGEASDIDIFNGIIKGYSEEDLDSDFKDSVKDAINSDRGGGFWIWKPYIIHKTMMMMKDNDYLVYADAGCTLNKHRLKRFHEYIDMIKPETGKSILAMELSGFKESTWTTDEILRHFDVDNAIKNSSQILATVCIYRKCPESMSMINAWLETAINRPLLFTDYYNDEAKRVNPEFIDNRHDQSIYSILLKLEPYKSNTILIDDEVDDLISRSKDKMSEYPILALRLRQ